MLGSHPVIIVDPSTNAVVSAMIQDGAEVWVGLKINNGSLMWFDNRTGISYASWAANEPPSTEIKKCVTLRKFDSTNNYWYSQNCSHHNSYICQRSRSHLFSF